MAASASPKRRQGPKRSEASRAAILEAAREELAENGWRNFSVDNLARRARASKQTIYRWWPSIGTICVEAALALIPDAPTSGRDPVERLAAIVVPIEATARTGSGNVVLRGAILAAADDEDAGERWRAWIKAEIRTPLRMLLAELANKGVIKRDWDIDIAMDRVLGPLWQRLIVMQGPVPQGFSRGSAEAFLLASQR